VLTAKYGIYWSEFQKHLQKLTLIM